MWKLELVEQITMSLSSQAAVPLPSAGHWGPPTSSRSLQPQAVFFPVAQAGKVELRVTRAPLAPAFISPLSELDFSVPWIFPGT